MEMIGLKNVNYVPDISPEELNEFFIEFELQRQILLFLQRKIYKRKSHLQKKGKISPNSPVGGKTKFQTINRNKLEKCHQIVFVLKYFVSKYIFCGICDFNDDEKNEIYDFIRELNENLVPSCEFLRKWTSDLARDSVDLKINGVTKASSDHLKLKDEISKLYKIYTDLKNIILSDIIHKETLKKIIESGSPGASESYHKLHNSLYMNHGRVSPDRQIDEEKLEQQTKNSLFKNLNEIAKQAGILEVKIVKLIEDLKKDKALNDKHEKIVLPNIIDEKIEFLTKNVKEILKNMEVEKLLNI
uniref:Uncharacterized protein n=1 Tax=Meloidogyne enterolobii TaxID=390850 RepID=A0A6V7UG40_MELEN|nr:unnamed protein product [Meloidogyne enterolobii]